MALFNLGISKIEIADIATDGGVGTVFAPLGLTQKGTAKLNFGDPEVQELEVEEFDVAADAITSDGEKVIEFTVANPDEDTLVKVFGGTKKGTGNNTVYEAPASVMTIEKTLKITPRKGLGFVFARCLITAKFTSDIGKENWLGLTVSAKALVPEKEGTSAWSTFRVAS